MFEGQQGLPVFKANGEEFLTIYKDICDLRADEKVLDVGSSRRQSPVRLTTWLTKIGQWRVEFF